MGDGFIDELKIKELSEKTRNHNKIIIPRKNPTKQEKETSFINSLCACNLCVELRELTGWEL